MPSQPSNTPGLDHAMHVFERAVREIPAYPDFLARRGVPAETIASAADFGSIPPMSKPDFVQRYRLDELLDDGDVTRAAIWSTSSGSSGRPTYWPRSSVSLRTSIEMFDRIFRNFATDRRRTLVVVTFAMGAYVGGTYILSAVLGLRARGHRLSVVTPGIESAAVIDALTTLAPLYDQVVLGGYPPFVKDLVDQAPEVLRGLDLELFMGGEPISEAWRDRLLDALGRAGEPERIRMLYGASDGGVVGYETAATIAVRRAMTRDGGLRAALLPGIDDGSAGDPAPPIPSFVEYDPELTYLEVDDRGYLLFTIDGLTPLVRYRLNDRGRVLSGSALAGLLRRHGHPECAASVRADAGYLLMAGRTDIATHFYALNLFPEQLRPAFDDPRLAAAFSGKFVLTAGDDADGGQTLRLAVELLPDAAAADGLIEHLRGTAVATLRRTSSEYRALHDQLGRRAEPTVIPQVYGSPGFEAGIKQRWTGAATTAEPGQA